MTVTPSTSSTSSPMFAISNPPYAVTFCLITIGRNKLGSPTELRVLPELPSETSIYYPRLENGDPVVLPPDLEREVVWSVNGLRLGERVEIVPKRGTLDIFEASSFTLTRGQQLISTGPVVRSKLRAPLPRAYPWRYDVILRGPGDQILQLDPVIIVDEGP